MGSRLTTALAGAAEPRECRYAVWDCDLPGFGLRISPAGARTWFVKYRGDGGGRQARQRHCTLGSFPTLSADAARRKARTILARVTLGSDPASELAALRREMTLAQLIELYASDGLYVQRGVRQGEAMKAQTSAYTMARLRNHVVPLLGKMRVVELTESDVEKFARDVAAGRTARDEKLGPRKRVIVKGGQGAARKVVRDLSAVLSFAQHQRLIGLNPVATANVRKTDNRRERYLSLAEVVRLGTTLQTLEEEGFNPKSLAIAKLWILTGARRNEISGLKWREINFEQGLLCLEDTKTGRSTRPLGTPALALLKSLRPDPCEENAFVFPAERGGGFYSGTKRLWPIIMQRAGLEGVTPHTLRHTLGSVAASSGEALLLIGAMLGHSNARSTQMYAHVDRDPARLVADRATGLLANALGMTDWIDQDAAQD